MIGLNAYLLGDVVYTGAETQMIRAIHRPSGARVALKLPVSDVSSARLVGRLLHEHEVLVKLDAVPGVARARALERQDNLMALVLEDPGFRSLERVLAERGRLPLLDGLRIALALSRVLDAVHAAGVVHKDIKPQSMLVDEAFTQVVLLDFGIASWLSRETTSASIPEALEGTLAYVSPEQTGRTARSLDSRTDLYSLGVTLFEMLSGQRPFLEKDALALVHAHLAKTPPALDSLVPDVPGLVARIVRRCLEKYPEERYQTAKGLAADLSQCLQMLDERGHIDDFPLGQKDFSPTLQIPQILVNRGRESQEINAAFERAAGGAVEILLLGGPSGVGKTALVRSVYREMAKAGRGLLLSGKHDQQGRSVPYSALAEAFRELMRNLAGAPKPVFDAWRARIEGALGPLSRVIADVVPELEWLMGLLPPLPVVPADMTYHRIKHSWIAFVRAITDASPPLVLFLDDMQWVDPASLELLETLLTDVGRKHLLLVAAYRSNEVEPSHPLWKLVEAVEVSGVKALRLSVMPLDEASVQEWLAVALSAEPSLVAPLAEELWSKTRGNPFFLGQLLLELYRQKRVRRNLDDGVWEWEQDAVERAAVTDDVLELMQRKTGELPAETQALLGKAACAGHGFSLAELSVLAGLSQTQVVRELRPALLAGLVIPQDGQYREAYALAQAARGEEMDAGYRFLHDRVQQVFYEQMAPEHRTRTHLHIGRRLQVVFEREGGSHQRLLELARHLNLGAGALASEAERKELARLNLRAAKAAKLNGSYRLQATLVEQAQKLLGQSAWQEEPQLSVELSLERIEADFLLKQFDEVHRRAAELLALPLPALPRLASQELRVRACLASGQYAEGERLGIAALAEQGISYPETNEECMALALRLIEECDAWLDRHPEGFGSMLADPSLEHILCDALESAMALCASIGSRPILSALTLARNVKQATERKSLTPAAPFLIGALAHGRTSLLGEYRGSVRWAQEGARAAARLASPFLSECSSILGNYLPYELPVEKSRVHYQTAVHAAAASGSFQGTSWGLLSELCYLDLWQGRPLGEVAKKERTQRDMMVRAGDAVGQHHFALTASFAAFLGAPESVRPAAGEDWLIASSRSFLAVGDGTVAEFARIQEAYLYLAFGEAALALERAEEAERFRHALHGNPPTTDIPLWRGLAAAQCWSPTLATAERTALSGTLEDGIARVRYFSQCCAENFLHKLLLLEAEQARIHGRTEEAMSKYDQAMSLARKEGFLHIEALAAQLCAEFHLQAGRERIGMFYLHEARDAYFRWNALALISHLEAKYPGMLNASLATAPSQHTTTVAATAAATDITGDVLLDVDTAIRAAQALSSELDPERVVGRLMDLVLENAGAQRGVLVLMEGDTLVVVARLSVDGTRIETGLLEPLGQSSDLAITVVQYVARSREPVVVNDVQSEKRFHHDPYLATHAVRSLLALPLTHRGRLAGVLSLEHRDAPAAFPPGRVAFLSVLATQAAIAVENAALYRNLQVQVRALQAHNQEMQQLNDELRRQIQQRSRQLMETLLSQDAPRPANAHLEVGSLLGDCYRIVRPIGEGGMGAVYEVERTTDGLRLAAKVLRSNPDRQSLVRFVREAHILASLDHPNLISIADVDVTSEGRLYIVMELVSGSSLREQRERFGDTSWVLSVLRQAAEALSVLHTQSIIHRDLKPENVLVLSESPQAHPVVKLVDFGVSIVMDEIRGGTVRSVTPMLREIDSGAPARGRVLGVGDGQETETSPRLDALRKVMDQRRAMLTQTGVVIGTPFYIAPELFHGSRNAQPPSDVFSLGIIAFELLVGEMPFASPLVLSGGSGQELASPSPLRQCAGLSLELAELFERCLSMDPTQRPTAQEIARRLQGA